MKNFLIIIGLILFACNVYAADYSDISIAMDDIAKQMSATSELKGKKIAVIGFHNAVDGRSDKVSNIIGDELENSLIKNSIWQVIARNQTDTILKELKTTSADIFSGANRKRFGKLASADVIVTGTYRVDNKMISINVQAIDIETGVALAAQKINLKTSKLKMDNVYMGSSEPSVWSAWLNSASFFNVKNKYGFAFGYTNSPNYHIEGYKTPTNNIESTLILNWFYFSYRFGGTGFWAEEDYQPRDSMDAFEVSLHIPIININERFILSTIIGYQYESYTTKIGSYGSGTLKELDTNGIVYGGAFRWIILNDNHKENHSGGYGLEFSYERYENFHYKNEIKNGDYFRINMICLWY
jgi:TolB-like protein